MTWGKFNRHPGGGLELDTLLYLDSELAAGRRKFVGNRFLLTAATEELGELAKALLQREGRERVRAKALQLAVVALRIYEEGDASHSDITAEESKP